MIEMSISRLVQVDRQINSVNSLLEEENRRQAWLADVAQQERWTAEQYGHELGLSCQRIAELSAELAGHYAHAASLKTHLANLYAELGEEVPEAFRKPQPKPAERIGDTGTGVDQAPDRSEPIPSPGDTAH
jgi:hypothetical protein